MAQYPRELIASSEGRRLLTRDDPLLFALLYLPDSLRFEDQPSSLAQFHIDLAEHGKTWINGQSSRHAWIAPRQSGKTTWIFLLLPMWAAAHGHIKFIAAFSDSEDQATTHLDTFKKELDSNELLRKDYPELCTPKMGANVKRYVSQSKAKIEQANGFVFVAKGIDAKSLGLKVGNTRPDLILLDDIEPPESNYSLNEVQKRQRNLLDAVFYLSDKCQIELVGTTTMSGSLIDQCRQVWEHEQAWNASHIVEQSDDKQSERYCADNSYYVSLNKDDLTQVESEIGTSFRLQAIEHAFSYSETREPFSSPESQIEAFVSPSHTFEPDSISQVDMAGENRGIDSEDGYINNPVNDNLGHSSDKSLTNLEACESSAVENDFNFQSVFDDASIPNNYVSEIENFEARQQRELARFETPKINQGELKLQESNNTHVDFYDSLDSGLHWIIDERIEVHYYPAIVVDSEGIEHSWWPEFKPMSVLERDRHTRAFAMNMMNRPVNVDAQYWNEHDIEIAELDEYRWTVLSVDPAVSTKQSSDYTAFVIVSLGNDGLVYVRHAEQLKLVSTGLRERANELIELFDVDLLLIETNQGGMVWNQVFDQIKCKYKAIHQTEPKPVRAARALDYYRKQKVRHTRHFDLLEQQMHSFPKVTHDDLVDALGAGVHYLLNASGRARIKKRSYL